MSRSLADLTGDLQKVSDIYAKRMGIRRDGDWYLLKIQEELGELAAEYLRLDLRKPGKGLTQGDVEEKLADEAADVLAQVLLFIGEEGIDIDSALERKWLKYLR